MCASICEACVAIGEEGDACFIFEDDDPDLLPVACNGTTRACAAGLECGLATGFDRDSCAPPAIAGDACNPFVDESIDGCIDAVSAHLQ